MSHSVDLLVDVSITITHCWSADGQFLRLGLMQVLVVPSPRRA